jgi:DNA/RNA-binding domain of Phe-tRNA-synthetase-like protein
LDLQIEPRLKELFPDLEVGCIMADVIVQPSGESLKEEIVKICGALATRISPESIRTMPVVEASKNAYRQLVKDPNRYRPSAESLLRRIASGKGLYYVNNMVDILNLVSVQTGFSIGGYDADKIDGLIRFGVGAADEDYEGIGRGQLNIENLPVFRDNSGAFGTSTSDSTRTMVTESTNRFLLVFPAFVKMDNELKGALTLCSDLLTKFGGAGNITTGIIK